MVQVQFLLSLFVLGVFYCKVFKVSWGIKNMVMLLLNIAKAEYLIIKHYFFKKLICAVLLSYSVKVFDLKVIQGSKLSIYLYVSDDNNIVFANVFIVHVLNSLALYCLGITNVSWKFVRVRVLYANSDRMAHKLLSSLYSRVSHRRVLSRMFKDYKMFVGRVSAYSQNTVLSGLGLPFSFWALRFSRAVLSKYSGLKVEINGRTSSSLYPISVTRVWGTTSSRKSSVLSQVSRGGLFSVKVVSR